MIKQLNYLWDISKIKDKIFLSWILPRIYMIVIEESVWNFMIR